MSKEEQQVTITKGPIWRQHHWGGEEFVYVGVDFLSWPDIF